MSGVIAMHREWTGQCFPRALAPRLAYSCKMALKIADFCLWICSRMLSWIFLRQCSNLKGVACNDKPGSRPPVGFTELYSSFLRCLAYNFAVLAQHGHSSGGWKHINSSILCSETAGWWPTVCWLTVIHYFATKGNMSVLSLRLISCLAPSGQIISDFAGSTFCFT